MLGTILGWSGWALRRWQEAGTGVSEDTWLPGVWGWAPHVERGLSGKTPRTAGSVCSRALVAGAREVGGV